MSRKIEISLEPQTVHMFLDEVNSWDLALGVLLCFLLTTLMEQPRRAKGKDEKIQDI